eukprot:SM000196S05365  [mRNA]  locus=s196:186709:205871:+ [translate_table: standard]
MAAAAAAAGQRDGGHDGCEADLVAQELAAGAGPASLDGMQALLDVVRRRSGGEAATPEAAAAAAAAAPRERVSAALLAMPVDDLARWLEGRLLGCPGATREDGPLWLVAPSVRRAAADLLRALAGDGDEAEDVGTLRRRLVDALLLRLGAAVFAYQGEVAEAFVALLASLARCDASLAALLQAVMAAVAESRAVLAATGPDKAAAWLGELARRRASALACLKVLLQLLTSVVARRQGSPAGRRLDGSLPTAEHSAVAGAPVASAEDEPCTASERGQGGKELESTGSVAEESLRAGDASNEAEEEGGDSDDVDDCGDDEEEYQEAGEEEGEEEEEEEEEEEGEEEEEEEDDGRAAAQRRLRRAPEGSGCSGWLARQVCTFTSSGSNFMEQHWYFCYTCDLTMSKGCCTVCARVCHRGHKVVYSRQSRFFCDCGAGGARGITCSCLKPRSAQPLGRPASGLAAQRARLSSDAGALWSDSDDSDEDTSRSRGDAASIGELYHNPAWGAFDTLKLVQSVGAVGQVLALCQDLVGSLREQGALRHWGCGELSLAHAVAAYPTQDLLRLRRTFAAGSFEMKVKTEYSSAKDLRAQLLSGSLTKSVLSVSMSGHLAVGEGDKVLVFEVGQLIGSLTAVPAVLEKCSVQLLSKNVLRFEAVHLQFNAANESHLAVAGYEECQIFKLSPGGEVTSRLSIDLALHDGTYIRRINWVPRSEVCLLIVSTNFIRIYDLSEDCICPVYSWVLAEDSFKDATIAQLPDGRLAVVILSQLGKVFIEYLYLEAGHELGARLLVNEVSLPRDLQQTARGVSIEFLPLLQLLVLTFESGQSILGRFDGTAAAFSEVATVLKNDGNSSSTLELHHWREVDCLSTSLIVAQGGSSAVIAAVLQGHVVYHDLPVIDGPSGSRIDGIVSWTGVTSFSCCHLLVLRDDGSLHVYDALPHANQLGRAEVQPKEAPHKSSSDLPQLGQPKERGKRRTDGEPKFPLTFFEKTVCVTSSVKVGGDILASTGADAAKMILASDDGFLESPSPQGFQLLVVNTNDDLVLVGCRVHVGRTEAGHIPSSLSILQRSINLEEGAQRWYDIPFTSPEARNCRKEFVLTIGPAFDHSSLPRIDTIEVYAMSKADMGWRDPAIVPTKGSKNWHSSAWPATSSTRFLTYQDLVTMAITAEQSLGSCMEFLRAYYLATSQPTRASMLLPTGQHHIGSQVWSLMRSIASLDTTWALKSSTQHLLQTICPSLEEFHQIRDELRLTALTGAIPELKSNMAAGGHRFLWAVRQFRKHVRIASNVSCLRPANFSRFLDSKGVGVVNDLCDVLQAILACQQLTMTPTTGLVFGIVDLLCGYAEYLSDRAHAMKQDYSEALAPAVAHFQQLLYSPYETARSACSLALTSRLLQGPLVKASGHSSASTEDRRQEAREGDIQEDHDTGGASVQYCCDGCSVCPIHNKRWHCEVCPDFDLCEACYEVMDQDMLPRFHQADHPMVAMLVEAEGMSRAAEQGLKWAEGTGQGSSSSSLVGKAHEPDAMLSNRNGTESEKRQEENDARRLQDHASFNSDVINKDNDDLFGEHREEQEEDDDEEDEEDGDEEEEEDGEGEEEEDDNDDDDDAEAHEEIVDEWEEIEGAVPMEEVGGEILRMIHKRLVSTGSQDLHRSNSAREGERHGRHISGDKGSADGLRGHHGERRYLEYGEMEEMSEESLLELAMELSLKQQQDGAANIVDTQASDRNSGNYVNSQRVTETSARDSASGGPISQQPDEGSWIWRARPASGSSASLLPDRTAREGGTGPPTRPPPAASNRVPFVQADRQSPPPEDHEEEPTTVSTDAPKWRRRTSASAAVGRALLSQLVSSLRGKLGTFSGLEALPTMQLLYNIGTQSIQTFQPEEAEFKQKGSDSRSNEAVVAIDEVVQLLLDELDLNRELRLEEGRIKRGEFAILCFTFFTLVLRSHESEKADLKTTSSRASTSFGSRRMRACTLLCTPALVSFLHSIVSRQASTFKKVARKEAASEALSSCDSLLSAKKDKVPGSCAPFLSDSYVQLQRGDPFSSFVHLLLESSLRLACNVARQQRDDDPAPGVAEASHEMSGREGLDGQANVHACPNASGMEDFCLIDWQDLLCFYISKATTSSLKKYARRLLLHCCSGKRAEYYRARDSWQLTSVFKRWSKLAAKTHDFKKPMSYKWQVKLAQSLAAAAEIAEIRPFSWQRHCLDNADVLPLLLRSTRRWGEESVLQALRLLFLAFYFADELPLAPSSDGVLVPPATKLPSYAEILISQSRISDKRNVSGFVSSREHRLSSSEEKAKRRTKKGERELGEVADDGQIMDMGPAAKLISEDTGVIPHVIHTFLLGWSSSYVRTATRAFLQGLWLHGDHNLRSQLLKVVLGAIPDLPSFGPNVVQFSDLLSWTLARGKVQATDKVFDGQAGSAEESKIIESCLNEVVIGNILATLKEQNELLANHPESKMYNDLQTLVDFEGYYLESEPCLACSSPDNTFTRMKLESLKSETKFTDNRILVKFSGSHAVRSLSMEIHDGRKSKSIKVLNLYYNNRAVSDLSELKNNWSLWKRAQSCQLSPEQTECKFDFVVPIVACNFMIEIDGLYVNLQAASLEVLQCPRCSRHVTDRHGICSHCHENAHQCRQCRNINYENPDSFLCNECGFSKYGRMEFHFQAKPSFCFDVMENEEDARTCLAAIEAESENAHRRYQQLMALKKPLKKLLISISEPDPSSNSASSFLASASMPQSATLNFLNIGGYSGGGGRGIGSSSIPVSSTVTSRSDAASSSSSIAGVLPASSSFRINRRIAILGVLYAEKCKAASEAVSKSVQLLLGLRQALVQYVKRSSEECAVEESTYPVIHQRARNRCYGCAITFCEREGCRKQLALPGTLMELLESSVHQGPKASRKQARSIVCLLIKDNPAATATLDAYVREKVLHCMEHHRSLDVAACIKEDLILLAEACSLVDNCWDLRLKEAFALLLKSIEVGAQHPVISEHIILPCLRIIVQACTLPTKPEDIKGNIVSVLNDQDPAPTVDKSSARTSIADSKVGMKHSKTTKGPPSGSASVPLITHTEWMEGLAYSDFKRRRGITVKPDSTARHVQSAKLRRQSLALKYVLRWQREVVKRRGAAGKGAAATLEAVTEAQWLQELAFSPCSQLIRTEACSLVELLCVCDPTRLCHFLSLLMSLLPAALDAGECSAEFFDMLDRITVSEDARLFLVCQLISKEVDRIVAQEQLISTSISEGFVLHKLALLMTKFIRLSTVRDRLLEQRLLPPILEALLSLKGLVVQKTKLTSDCMRLLQELLNKLLEQSPKSKADFIRACILDLQQHSHRTSLYVLEQLVSLMCPTKPEPVHKLILSKAHTQEEFIRGSMTNNPYSSAQVGPLMRDVKNKICQQLELLGLLDDDFGMELLVAGNIIALDLPISRVYEQVWKKAQRVAPGADIPLMTITYRLQGLDGEATEPMIKELDDETEEAVDPELEFAVAGVMADCGGLAVLLDLIQALRMDVKGEEVGGRGRQNEGETLLLDLLRHCCKLRKNRHALLCMGALQHLLLKARAAFLSDSVQADVAAEKLLVIVESLVTEANESDVPMGAALLTVSGESARSSLEAEAVSMFLDKLSRPPPPFTSSVVSSGATQQGGGGKRNDRGNAEAVARLLPYLTFGEQHAMEVLVDHFVPLVEDWRAFDTLQDRQQTETKDEGLKSKAADHVRGLENFVRVVRAIKVNSHGQSLRNLILQRGIVKGAVRHLQEIFPDTPSRFGTKGLPGWQEGLRTPSIPIILGLLEGLAKCHQPTQRLLQVEGVLPLLHALEGMSGETGVGEKAEMLLDTVSGQGTEGEEGFLTDEVLQLRSATREEMKKRALQKREELLQATILPCLHVINGMGMRRITQKDGEERIVLAEPALVEGVDLAEVEEEGGFIKGEWSMSLSCMVCREGYRLRPTDMLGAYCFSKRVNIIATAGRTDWAYSTVSHFNVIHFQCHTEAKRADSALKAPKKEWEGATLRNSETLCNSLFPLRAHTVAMGQYARCVDSFWESMAAVARADGSRLRLLLHDIALRRTGVAEDLSGSPSRGSAFMAAAARSPPKPSSLASLLSSS